MAVICPICKSSAQELPAGMQRASIAPLMVTLRLPTRSCEGKGLHPRASNFLFANAVSSSVWAVSYSYAAYWAGREFEHSHRHVAIFLVIIAVIVIIAAGIFVHRREAQLIAEAERAMPGPLKLR